LYQGREIGFLEFAEVREEKPELGTWYIMTTRVSGDFRRRGIASQMLKEAEKHMSGTVTLDAFTGEAEAFWKSQGFERVPGRGIMADTIRMVKQL
jgi:ribosomal protein S18 acetylase RimI-like enzyme